MLKFVQASFFKIDIVGEKVFKHFNWLDSIPREPRLTNITMRMLQTGAIYIFGRDKFYRPCIVMDAEAMARLMKEDPNAITGETFADLWVFLYMYIKNVMLLPGHIDNWVNIVNFGKLGITALPRKPILAFAGVCQANMMYFLAKSYYVNVSWGQMTLYKTLSSFINEETRAKICLTGDNTHAELATLFHPCQLERRFGGTIDTPTNFWPPYVGPEFVPLGQEDAREMVSEEDYPQCIAENPELLVHPEYAISPNHPQRDFEFA